MKTLYLFLFIILLSACTEKSVFTSEKNILEVDKLENENDLIVLTSKHLYKINTDSQKVIWKVKSDYHGDIILKVSGNIFILNTNKGSEVGIHKIDPSNGHTLCKYDSDTISMYKLIVFKNKGKEYYWAKGEVINNDTIINMENEVTVFTAVNKDELKWLSFLLRPNSRVVNFKLLKRILAITKEIPKKEDIRYVQFNNEYLILEYHNYFNYYSIPAGKMIGQINTEGFGLRTLRSHFVIEPIENRVINLKTQEIEETKKHQLDIIFLKKQRYNVYHKDIRKVN